MTNGQTGVAGLPTSTIAEPRRRATRCKRDFPRPAHDAARTACLAAGVGVSPAALFMPGSQNFPTTCGRVGSFMSTMTRMWSVEFRQMHTET